MEHKFYTDNFERLLKEKSDEFRMYPSKRVWHSIYNDLHPGRKWPSFAISLILVTALFLIGYWNNQINNTSAGSKSGQISSVSIKPGAAGLQHNDGAVLQPRVSSSAISAQTGNQNQPNSADDLKITNSRYRNTASISSVTGTGNEYSNNTSTGNLQGSETSAIVNNVTSNNISAKNTGSPVNYGIPEEDAPIFPNQTAGLLNPSVENNGTESSNRIDVSAGNAPEKLNSVKTVELSNNVLAVQNVNALRATSTEDKKWMEQFTLYNKKNHHKSKGRIGNEIYFTPGLSFRKMTNNTNGATVTPSPVTVLSGNQLINTNAPAYIPGLSFEMGMSFSYALSKNVKLKAGLQANFTNYGMEITELNHPVLTTLLLKNTATGTAYLEPRATSIANVPGSNNKKIHNQTSQISISIGMAFKIAGNKKIDWYLASSIQPTYVFSGKTNLISADHYNYISDVSMLRNWNMNAAAGSYVQYKTGNVTLQIGPEFRTQLFSTYLNKYSYSEKLYNIGIKAGVVKNF